MPCGITTWSFVSLQVFGLAIFVYLLAESTHRHAQAYRDVLPPSLCSAGKPHVATGLMEGLVRLDRLQGVG